MNDEKKSLLEQFREIMGSEEVSLFICGFSVATLIAVLLH